MRFLSKLKESNVWLLWTVAVFFIFLFLAISGFFIIAGKYKDKIYPGVHVQNFQLGGLTAAEAESLINNIVDKINQTGISFRYQNVKKTIYPVTPSFDNDLTIKVVDFDVDQTMDLAYNYGRQGDIVRRATEILRSLFFKEPINILFSINTDELKKQLKENFSQFENPDEDAKLIVTGDNIKVTNEKNGQVIDYEQAAKVMETNLLNLNSANIPLELVISYPKVHANDLSAIAGEAGNMLNLAPVFIKIASSAPSTKNHGKKWEVKKSELALWLIAKDTNENQPTLALYRDKVKEFLDKKVAPDINIELQDAKFKIENGKVVQFQGGRDGLAINTEETISKIEKELLINHHKEIELITEIISNTVKAGDVNDLGITEIIGTGQSNFAGSPTNRRHNIRVGANAVNGSLIKPGQEYSLLRTLGKIDASTGYLTELVIKGDKTTPEFGGGLCQIGTTVFRGALASGLPITARQNHSYRVGYYEPAGTDATIYDPAPDFRFMNDTGHYILIQARINGNNLYFDFWGTKDGRQVVRTKPVIGNIVKPQPGKLVETLTLKPGEKKCTEKAHNGADAYFDYTVTYADGIVKLRRFKSHYVPWQEVCLIGVEKLSEPTKTAGTGQSSTTPESNMLNTGIINNAAGTSVNNKDNQIIPTSAATKASTTL
jgi:vancomycin resistance protein YoaR